MPLQRLEWTPGVNVQQTQTQNKSGWFGSNLVRWRNGLLEKLAGWQALFGASIAGIARSIHAYEDLLLNVNLMIAGDGGPQIFIQGKGLFNLSLVRRAVSFNPFFGIFDLGGAFVVGASSTTSMRVVAAAGVPAGSTIVVCVLQNGVFAGQTISDSNSNVYSLSVNYAFSSVGSLLIYVAANASLPAGGVITFSNNTGVQGMVMAAMFVTGAVQTSPVDAATIATAWNFASGSPASVSVTSGVPAISGEYFIAVSALIQFGEGPFAVTFTQDSVNAAYAFPPDGVLAQGAAGIGQTLAVAGGSVLNPAAAALTYAPSFSWIPTGLGATWAAAILGIKPLVFMQPTVGSKVIVVTDSGHGASTGNTVIFPMSMSVGGRIIPGNTSFSITVLSANTWQFSMANNATNTNNGAPPVFTFNTGLNADATVTFNNHGLVGGQQFVIQEQTSFVDANGVAGFGPINITILAGSRLMVKSVIDPNNFTFAIAPYGTSNLTTAIGVTEGNNYVSGVVQSYGIWAAYVASAPAAGTPWFTDNFGTYGLVCYQGGPIFSYTPPVAASPFLINTGSGPASTGATMVSAPQINAGMIVAMPQAQIIAFGSETIIGSGQQDPLLVRWSDAGSLSIWTATATNQAGSFHLGSSGSKIIGAIQAPQTTLIFTDVDVWSMSYVGPPFVYSFSTIGTACGLIGPHAVALFGRTCLWMARRGFFAFSDGGMKPVECPVWDVIFNDLDTNNLSKICFGTNMSAYEVFMFYPSVSGGLGECDKYIKVNLVENLWDFGSLQRTAWIAENAFGTPLGTDLGLLVQQHETGYDANGVPMSGVYAETGYADLSDGEQMMLVDELIQDMKWFGSGGSVAVTLRGIMYPGDDGQGAVVKGPYGMDQGNQHIRPRMRARQIALRFDWAAQLGFSARLGTPRARVKQSGRHT